MNGFDDANKCKENCREDLQDISRFLRKEHPEIWKEYINKQ